MLSEYFEIAEFGQKIKKKLLIMSVKFKLAVKNNFPTIDEQTSTLNSIEV